jgi:topoisomerase-4 subunit B
MIENFDEKDTSDRNGTEISFIPDGDIFLHFKFRKEYIERMLRNYAYLNPGLKILFNGETYFLKTVLKTCWKKSWKTNLYPIVHLKDNDIEVAITHSDKSQTETYFSFVNGQNTTQGGTHLNAFREAYVKTIREFFNKNFDASDIRKSIVAAFPSM